MYQVEVIPLTLLPISRSPFFTYKCTEAVPYGSLLTIPFGSQVLQGISTACKQQSHFPSYIKSIIAIEETSLVTEKQILFAKDISETTFTPLGKTLRHTLPKTAKKLLAPEESPALKPAKISKKYQTLLDAFLASPLPTLHISSALVDHTLLFAVALHNKANQKQTLILAPEILQLLPLESEARKYFPSSQIAVLHSHLTPKEYKSRWMDIKTGATSLILATRQGLFAPFHDLASVIVTDEQDQGYKQWDMSPRYEGREAAFTLAKLHQAKLLLTTEAPSLRSLYQLQRQELSLLNPFRKQPVLKDIEIINLRIERYQKNFSPLSAALKEALTTTIKKGGQALIIIPTRGIASYSVCAGCKKIFRCPESSHTLRETRQGHYECPGCTYKTSLFPSCPHCGHLEFWQRGLGTEKLEEELHKLFPYTRTARLDGETVRKHKDLISTYEAITNGEIPLLIGTRMLEKRFPLPNLDLIAIIDADNSLSSVDFRGDEHFLQSLTKLSLGRDTAHTRFIIQSFEPEHHFLRKLKEKSYHEVAEELLEGRTILKYPPSSLTYGLHKNTLTAQSEKKATALLTKLTADFPEAFFSLREPKKLSLKNTPTLLIRYPLPIDREFHTRLQALTPYYTVDVNPLHFS